MLGGPGAGKGTQAKRLGRALNIPWISTGDIFRDAIASDTDLGREVKGYVERGDLVPDRTAIALMRERLQQDDAASGWILDGYPRTAFQAEELDMLLDDLGQTLDKAIYLNVSEAVLVERSVQRSAIDDDPETIRRRIAVLHETTVPMLDYYSYRKMLVDVDGALAPEQVQETLWAALGLSTS
ncbi:MAG: adenylate kinase [Cyanobacteria bacterium J06639_1]